MTKFLYNEQAGKMPKSSEGKEVPALIFANSRKNTYFGDMYLFANFGIAGGCTINAPSDITTHYVEDNSAIQDHWALSPVTYTLNGFIGEIIYRPAEQWTNWLQDNVRDYLSPLEVISPTVSSYVQSAMNVTHQLEATYQKYSNYAESIMRTVNNWTNPSIKASNQYQVYQQLKNLRQNRVLVDIYTPYDTLKSMAITNISMSQDDKSMYKSSITVTLQEYRDVKTLTRKATDKEVASLVKAQQAQEVNQGNAKIESTEFANMIDPKWQNKYYTWNK